MSDPAAPAPAAAPESAAPAPAPSGRVSAADLAAELEAAEAKEGPADEADAEPAADAPAEPETPADEDSDDKADDEDADESAADAEAEDDEEADPADPVAAKRIAAIQKAEKRSKEQVAQWRTEAQRDLEREWAPVLQEQKRIAGVISRASSDPLALAAEFKWDAETKLYAAQQLYADAKAEQGDPKYREQAARAKRDREVSGGQTALQKEVADLKAKLDQQDGERRVDLIATRAETAIGDKAPVLRHMMAKNPAHTRERIREATALLRKQSGADPDPATVIATLEEVERYELSARGIDPLAAIGAAKKAVTTPVVAGAKPKNKTHVAGEKPTAKPSPVVTKPPPNGRVSSAQIARELEELEAKEATG